MMENDLNELNELLDEQYELLKYALSEVEKMCWQPLDTAPEDVEVLVALDNGFRDICQLESDMGLWINREFIDVEPSCWMPLPEPPKEKL